MKIRLLFLLICSVLLCTACPSSEDGNNVAYNPAFGNGAGAYGAVAQLGIDNGVMLFSYDKLSKKQTYEIRVPSLEGKLVTPNGIADKVSFAFAFGQENYSGIVYSDNGFTVSFYSANPKDFAYAKIKDDETTMTLTKISLWPMNIQAVADYFMYVNNEMTNEISMTSGEVALPRITALFTTGKEFDVSGAKWKSSDSNVVAVVGNDPVQLATLDPAPTGTATISVEANPKYRGINQELLTVHTSP